MTEFRVYGSNMINTMLVSSISINHSQQTDFTKNDIRSAGCMDNDN